MAPRDSYFHPVLSETDALAMAREDWDAMERRHEAVDGSADEAAVIRALADAYRASNRSTMRACARVGGVPGVC
jgi:hypothetical protein